MPRPKRRPAYSLHKATGQARVRIDGRDHYLGEYGSAESRERYDELVAEWLSRQDASGVTLTVDDLALLYLEHARRHFRKSGRETSAVHCVRLALRHLVKVHGRTRVRRFGPKALKEARQSMIDAGYARSSINGFVGNIRRMFRWAVAEELVPESVWRSLQAVTGLQQGRTEAREPEPILPVAEEVVSRTLPHLPRVVADMVRLQLLTGARPGEVCTLHPRDVTIGTNGVWTYRPTSHKTEHHGRERRIFIGPEGQAVLRPYLQRDPDSYCFSPAESEAERSTGRRANRKASVTPSQAARRPKRNRKRPPKDHYSKDAYNRAVRRACEKAKVTVWTPNQLRHTRATLLRERYGIEAAQIILGHGDPKTTENYAERDYAKAADIMREIG